MSEDQCNEVVRGWRESARYWEKHRDAIGQMFAPITEALVEGARVEPGHRVLDVAGGTGEPSLTVARAAGAGGLVVMTDIAPGMVAAARREAERRGAGRMAFALASGTSLPFAAGSFDRVVCRLGVMFFPDVPAALADMLRVLRPGGLVALAVWGSKEHNPYFRIPSEVISRYVESPPEPPDAPSAWRFGEPGRLAGLLAEAGAADVAERRVEFVVETAMTFDEFWWTRTEMSDTLRTKLGGLPPDVAAAVTEDVREATREFFPGGRMRFPADVLIATGARPPA